MNLIKDMQVANTDPYKVSKKTGVNYRRIMEIISGDEPNPIELSKIGEALNKNYDVSKVLPDESCGVQPEVLEKTKRFLQG